MLNFPFDTIEETSKEKGYSGQTMKDQGQQKNKVIQRIRHTMGNTVGAQNERVCHKESAIRKVFATRA